MNSQMAELKEIVDSAKVQAALVASVDALSENVKRLTVTVDENNRRLERLSVLEANHSNQSSALGRAFNEIEEVRGEIGVLQKANAEEHKRYDKYLWLAVGFITAISVVWSVVGYRMMDAIDRVQSAIARMDNHVEQDKIMNQDDLPGGKVAPK